MAARHGLTRLRSGLRPRPAVDPSPCASLRSSHFVRTHVWATPVAPRFGCPTWIRTMTRRVKVACATITPSGSEVRNDYAAPPSVSVKVGKYDGADEANKK